MQVETVRIKRILTRVSGFLQTVCSHSLQPYAGCAFGNSLCGAGCYVQHNHWITRGRPWGSFLQVRENAADAYAAEYASERAWARRSRESFRIFMSSATEPFMPQEARFGITRRVLERMIEMPPDDLIVQTHSHRVVDVLDLLQKLPCRVHVSIETDREDVPGLPPHASPLQRRFEAAAALRAGGVFVVATVSPLLPIADPERFFHRLSEVADAVVVDHFIEGDGTPDGRRTFRTRVPAACQALDPESISLAYRDRMVALARRHFERVGVNVDGFAGRWL